MEQHVVPELEVVGGPPSQNGFAKLNGSLLRSQKGQALTKQKPFVLGDTEEDDSDSLFTVSSTLHFNQKAFSKKLISDGQNNELISACVQRPVPKRKMPAGQDASHPISANQSPEVTDFIM